MKYYFVFLVLLPFIFSCKSKKVATGAYPTRDTMYVDNPTTGEINMIITNQNIDPAGSWTPQFIDGESDEEMQRISMQLSTQSKEKTVSGNDACNMYSGSITTFDMHRIEFGPLASTKRACFVPAKFAQLFYNTMQKVKSYSATNDYLIFKDGSGKKVMQLVRKVED